MERFLPNFTPIAFASTLFSVVMPSSRKFHTFPLPAFIITPEGIILNADDAFLSRFAITRKSAAA
jgi:hypothetical protein